VKRFRVEPDPPIEACAVSKGMRAFEKENQNMADTTPRLTAKVRRIEDTHRYVCDCGSVIVEQEDAEYLMHDQFERNKNGALNESKPLTCKWSGVRFEIPTVELKQQLA
jgi:hypothetical protein